MRRSGSVEVADVDAVDGDPAAGDVVQARHQRGQRGLAGAGGADDRDGLAGRDLEVDVAQHRLVGCVGEGEADVLEAQVAARRSTTARSPPTMSGSVSKISRIRSAAVIASCAMARMTPSDGDRPDQREHQGDERDQRAGGELAVADAERAEQQHDARRRRSG